MINLYTWARKWNIPIEAVNDLRIQMGIDPSQGHQLIDDHMAGTEAGVGARLRLQVAKAGGLLWRNNVGAMQDDNGRVVRFGLANESKAVNKKVKSSDYIGIIPTKVLPVHVGMVIGQFCAIETKEPGWKFKGTERELAQQKFLALVISRGGFAKFYNGLDEIVISE